MKIDDIREMSVTDLHEKLEELRVELFNLRFQKSKNLLDRTDRLRIVRRNIARINTVLNAKEER
ncbi:MAG TPA: 50S ribosomal protein L29 [Candidatus Syntrophosphaera sp.]|jgi:large subunit ribosomal protein L29|nr:50S ribosomal protein L29 [Candidatus Cloacimonadota bacterium]OQB92578.1 MAG: 50S ribosomal protein L29 [Candidatus Cloacimonetes bacterium ADurb.Bin117]HNU54257.1 50S ribosomal protein L29 [Candidatus Syntrophosphaera sp.]MDI9525074.1 50S ribosomal protein L29 [Candidatus Cloacimonadota bacterium]NLH93317.1 50S ribosomal protein L29 [Candidatus Cloacimonadota bacterium]